MVDELKHGKSEAEANLEEVTRLRQWIEKKVGAQPEDVIHPLFGEIIKDLGYKKIYATSCAKLANIPVWEQQRIFRKERAEVLASDIERKLKNGQTLTLPGVITIFELNGQYGLLDGTWVWVRSTLWGYERVR